MERFRRRLLLAVLVLMVVPLLGGLAAAQSPPGSYLREVDITFPVSGEVDYGDDYDASRGGGTRIHQATDIFGEKLQGLHAAVDGEICRITGVDEPMPSWGYSISLCGYDGLVYRYIHINNDNPGTDDGDGGPEWAYAPGIALGDEVARGQWLGYLGDSGNAETTPPHLHFEIRDPELSDPQLERDLYEQGRINPYASLESAQRRGDVPAPPGGGPRPDLGGEPELDPETATTYPVESVQLLDPPDQVAGIQRLAGPDRIATALELSRQRSAASTVIVAPSGSHAEALVAAPLAGLLGAPVLLSAPEGLDDEVAEEVRRLGADNAYVMGRGDQLSGEVESDLADAGVADLTRLEAPDPFELSAVVARELLSYPLFTGRVERVFVALGESEEPSRAWPDALSASALAAELRAPILLVRRDELSPAVADVLAELDPSLVSIVGGPVAIGEQVVARAGAQVPIAAVERLAGVDRYGTSVAVAAEARREGMVSTTVWVATGLNFPDALAAGPAAARYDSPLLLVDGQRPGGSPDADAYLRAGAASLYGAVLVGGSEAISDPVSADVERLLEG